MKVVIMGCGRVGAQLAIQLDREGHEVTVLDLNAGQFQRFLPPDFRGRKVVGDGRDQDALRRAGVEGADAFVSVTQGDNRNVMAAQMAKIIFNVPRVVCRIYDPMREEMYHMLGLHTISPTRVGAALMMRALTEAEEPTAVNEPLVIPPPKPEPSPDTRPTKRDANYVIVVGGGRVGFYLARELLEQGFEVLVIEKDETGPRAAFVAEQLGSAVIRGDGCEASVLREAGSERAAMLIAVTGDDEDNLVSCQVAKGKWGVPKTIARLNDPRNEFLFKSLGIDVTVSATAAILDKIEMELPLNRLNRLLTLRKGDLEMVEIQLPERSPVVGQMLKDIRLPYDSRIVLLVDTEGTPRLPSADSVLRGGDEVFALIHGDAEEALRAALTGQTVGSRG
jgi:trk system potassium uptake protein TrkA